MKNRPLSSDDDQRSSSSSDDVAQPGTPQPLTAQPGTSQLGTAQPRTAQSGTVQPGTAPPGAAQPRTAPPRTAPPRTAQPGTAPPGAAQPGAAQPGTAQPGTAQPGTAQPRTAQSGSAQPRTAQPGTAQPGTAQPGGSRGRARGRARGPMRGRRGARDVPDYPPAGWSRRMPTPNVFEYRENAGPTHDLAFNADELQFLIACVGPQFFADMATSTNLYAAHSGAGTSWYDTNEREMRFFFGLQIMMGIKQQPEYRDYWSQDPVLGDTYISSRITRNRYTDLSKYLHLTDPATEDGADKLTKVRPFLTHLQRSFPQLFTPGVALSLDEAMIKYNGRLKWKQYMPMKPTKWGIKLWVLCDAITGYCLALNVYTGKEDRLAAGLGLTYNVVMKLMSPRYLMCYHHLYADNFYTSLPLVRDLRDADTYYCGTIRKNSRGVPAQMATVPLQRGESEKLGGDHDIVLTRWRDKRDVYIVATNTDGSDGVKPRSRFCAELMSVPNMILDYNHHMGGVDHLDQFRAYYDVGRAGRKWWKYIMFGLFNFAIVNAYILKCLANKPLPSNRRQWSLKAFKVALVHQLCDGFASRKRASMSSVHEVQDVIERDVIPGHDIVRFVGRKKACQACLASNQRTPANRCVVSVYGCSLCRASLCRGGRCFQEFHALL